MARFRQTLITDYYKPVKKTKKYKTFQFEWKCLECGDFLGYDNPRQLCGKSYCYKFI